MAKSPIPSGSLLDLSKRGYMDHAGVLAQHEAAHAVVALGLELGVVSATIGLDALDGGGRVRLDGKTPPGYAHLWVLMAGGVGTGDPVRWRPLDVGHGDESALAMLVDHLGLSEDGWRDAERETRMLLELPRVARAWRAISAALYERVTLDGAELKRLFDEAA